MNHIKRQKKLVKAGKNTWTDTGEHRDSRDSKYCKPTPRNRKPVQKTRNM